jgi:hypothetical protein
MTEEEARRSGLPLSIGGAAGQDIRRGPSRERSENITTDRGDITAEVRTTETRTTEVRVQEKAPEPVPVRDDSVPQQAPELVIVPERDVVIVPPAKTLEEQIAEAKQFLQDLGMDIVDKSDPAAAPVIVIPEPSLQDTFIATVKKPCLALRAWRETVNIGEIVWRTLSGFRTIIFFGALGILGLLDMLQTIDLRATLKLLLPTWEDERIGNLMTALALIGLMLRFSTTTPVFRSWSRNRRSMGDGYARGVGTGSVDEPETP